MALKTVQVGPLAVHVLPAFNDNYIYLLARGDRAAVVDPGRPAPVRQALREHGLRLELILLTHGHGDHTAGVPALRGENPEAIVWRPAELDSPSRGAFGDEVLGCALEAIPTPGHTRADHSLHLPEAGAVFTGDTLFVGGCGRLFECDPATMWASFQRLRALPDETLVFCGHEYTRDNYEFALSRTPDDPVVRARLEGLEIPSVPSTIGEEKRSNIMLRAGTAETFARLRAAKDEW